MRILLIEDDKLIGDGIKVGLTAYGYSVDWFTDGSQGQQALLAADYDAVILDLGLPKIDGMQILSYWRKNGLQQPIIILTARDAIEQRVTGLQCGADDYLCKPFALEELSARLQTIIRRTHGQSSSELVYEDIRLNIANRQVTRDNQSVSLTTKEVNILELFLLNPNRLLSRELLQEKLYSWDTDVSSNTVDVYIHNLRKKLGNKIIKTVYGAGYILGNEQ
ncbi:response regulator [Entomomonas asaccharolytica]|uniref:Response regulator n=1 Tax=Entomomonas asaccharolytica TaxID=2785331 RepID=A0A974ND99_9GAMM|nr:response regulator [Entomomonas asaccharolytica]QQP84615.1 response regulator [Entomomonas asaccharolytica]